MSWLGNLTRNIFNNMSPANKVLEVRSDKYSNRDIICREDSFVFYGPSSKDNKFEIAILQAYCEQAYSIYRSQYKEEVETKFIILREKLPVLVSISPTVNTLSGIQKVCDEIELHPSWTVAHLAVNLNFTDCLSSQQVLSHLNIRDQYTGETPLHLAIKQRNLAVVRQLIALQASLDQLDNESNSVFHFAASSNTDIIMALLTNGQHKCLNVRNIHGYTPLHIACLADKPDCVHTLLSKGADVNISATHGETSSLQPGYVGDFMEGNTKKLYIQDMKFGGTPLHWSCSREVIEQLVDRNCDINVLNFQKRTALHVMVMRNRLECVVALLSRHADLNIADEDGNTALHLAILGKNIAIIQALIVFSADLAYVNKQGESPRHLAAQEQDQDSLRILYLLHAVGAPRCQEESHHCTDGCTSNGTQNGIAPDVPQSAKIRSIMKCMERFASNGAGGNMRGGRLLCLDGGGIRGLVLVIILLHLESHVKQPIIHCFDWVAGTSTGAILALALASGQTLKDCLCLYFRMKEYAFSGNRPYNSQPLETMLQQTLGSDTVMSEIEHPKLMIMGVLADRKPVELHIFRNYLSPSELVNPSEPSGRYADPPPMHEQLLWKAARASGAAPSYFRAFGRFIDGGLIANNPTMDALTEIHEYNTALKVVGRGAEAIPPKIVVSVGTGCIPVTQLDGVDVFRPESLFDTARFARGLSVLGNVLVDQATLADGRVIDRCNAWCAMLNIPYFRFSPQLSEDIAMDEKKDEKLINMLWETKSYIFSNDQAVRQLAALLTCEGDTSQGSKRTKRVREDCLQAPPHDIKFLSKRVKVNTSELDSEDEPCTSYNLWRKYF